MLEYRQENIELFDNGIKLLNDIDNDRNNPNKNIHDRVILDQLFNIFCLNDSIPFIITNYLYMRDRNKNDPIIYDPLMKFTWCIDNIPFYRKTAVMFKRMRNILTHNSIIHLSVFVKTLKSISTLWKKTNQILYKNINGNIGQLISQLIPIIHNIINGDNNDIIIKDDIKKIEQFEQVLNTMMKTPNYNTDRILRTITCINNLHNYLLQLSLGNDIIDNDVDIGGGDVGDNGGGNVGGGNIISNSGGDVGGDNIISNSGGNVANVIRCGHGDVNCYTDSSGNVHIYDELLEEKKMLELTALGKSSFLDFKQTIWKSLLLSRHVQILSGRNKGDIVRFRSWAGTTVITSYDDNVKLILRISTLFKLLPKNYN